MRPQPAPRRPYRSPVREHRARETRRSIVGAAARLFVQRGYGGTTLDLIAAEARVSSETVYAAFGNKRTILRRAIQVAVSGSEDDRPLLEGPGPQEVRVTSDQWEQLRLFAADIGERLERVAPLMEVLATAAKSEPEMAELLTRLHRGRLDNLRVMVEWLSANGGLRLGLDEAADSVWALASPEMYRLLVVERGWSRERFGEWLADSLAMVLLSGTG